MTTTPEMGLVLPTDGGSSGVWSEILDTVFGIIDGHSHLPGSGVPVVSGALNINADLSFAGNALTNGKTIAFTEQAATSVASYVDAIFVNSSDHNLYFRNASGTNVQITSGSTINVSIVGGIGGDYTSVNALLQYNDAAKNYFLQQEGTPRPWAGLSTADISLYQKALIAGSPAANAVTLKSPASLAASYAVTFPAALPGSTVAMQLSSTGAVTASNTLASLTLSAGTVGHTGTWTYRIPVAGSVCDLAAQLDASCGFYGGTASTATFGFPLTLQPGDTIVAYRVYVNKQSNASSNIHVGIWGSNALAATATLQTAGVIYAANAPGGVSIGESGLSIVVTDTNAASICHYIKVQSSGSTLDNYFHCEVDVTH